jgi:hypothetical protein
MSKSLWDRRSQQKLFASESAPTAHNCVVELRHVSRHTGKACRHWIRRTVVFHNGAHFRDMPEGDANLLTHLAVGANAASSTQDPSWAAMLLAITYCNNHVARVEGRCGPESRSDCRSHWPAAGPKYLWPGRRMLRTWPSLLPRGSGLRLLEGFSLSVNDFDFGRREILGPFKLRMPPFLVDVMPLRITGGSR